MAHETAPNGQPLPHSDVVTRVKSDLFNADFCASCEMMGLYTDTAHGFVGSLAIIMHEGILNLFIAILPLWFVISLFLLMVGGTNIAKFARNFLYIILTYIFLKNNGPAMVSGIFSLSLELIGNLGQITFLKGNISVWERSDQFASAGIVNLVYSAEKSIKEIFDYGLALTSGAGFFASIGIVLFLLVFVYLPYTAITSMFFAKMVIAVFRIILLSVFSPVLMFFSAFDWGRDMGKAALKTLLASIFIAIACSSAMSLVVYAIGELINSLVTSAPTGKDVQVEAIWPVLFMLATFAWMGIAFQVDAVGIANSWAGSMLSGAGAALMTGAMTTMAILGGKGASSAAGGAFGGMTGLDKGALGRVVGHGAGLARGAVGGAIGGMMSGSAADKASRLYEIAQGSKPKPE